MQSDIEFDAEGTTLRGWLFRLEGAGPHPIVVMAHGFSGLKEQYLDRFAKVFASAGLASLVFDNRNFGASDGTPRQEIDPVAQMRDYRHAITFARTLPGIDPERVGVWGTSYSGGHAIVLGAIDRRVRCVVAQVPAISGYTSGLRRTRPDLVKRLQARFIADREARYRGEPPAMVPVVSQDPTALCALAGEEAYDYFQRSLKIAPHRQNEVTLRSLEMAREYEPGVYISRISPTPLLMIVTTNDPTTPTDISLQAFERALAPKKLVLVEGGHFTLYVEEFDRASREARDWFVEHLLPARA
jgi:fermentation-respiration switch protein FrsA (DUF1100 family)